MPNVELPGSQLPQMKSSLNIQNIVTARNIIGKFIHQTPVFTSTVINNLCGRNIYFKAENLQKTGSFKARGAVHAVSKCVERSNSAGVITHSSGNHGAALAYASKCFNVPCKVVVPANAPEPKKTAILAYGAEIVMCKPTMDDRVETCRKLEESTGMKMIHPHDNLDVIQGQGTIGLELIEQIANLDAVLVPTGGGGMASGIATVIKSMRPDCKVFCVEPEGKNLQKVLELGKADWSDTKNIDTLADGMRVKQLGKNFCFDIVNECCEKQVFTVNDSQIRDGLRLTMQQLKLVIKTSSATGVAALFTEQFQNLPSNVQNVAVILCGGNIDLESLSLLLINK